MLIVLQRGHVPRTRGATGAPGEQSYARGVTVVDRAQYLLTRSGFDVRVIDADESAHRYQGDVFIAVHYDGSVNRSARGASVGYSTAEGRQLAHAWKAAYQLRGFAGGFRPDNYTGGLSGYYGTRHAIGQGNRRAFILEGGFGSHPVEGPWLRSGLGMQTCAVAIRDACVNVMGGDMPLTDSDKDDIARRTVDQLMGYAGGDGQPESDRNVWWLLRQLRDVPTGVWNHLLADYDGSQKYASTMLRRVAHWVAKQ